MLLKLSLELRLEIMKLCFDQISAKIDSDPTGSNTQDKRSFRLVFLKDRGEIDLPLVRSCRQLRNECLWFLTSAVPLSIDYSDIDDMITLGTLNGCSYLASVSKILVTNVVRLDYNLDTVLAKCPAVKSVELRYKGFRDLEELRQIGLADLKTTVVRTAVENASIAFFKQETRRSHLFEDRHFDLVLKKGLGRFTFAHQAGSNGITDSVVVSVVRPR